MKKTGENSSSRIHKTKHQTTSYCYLEKENYKVLEKLLPLLSAALQ